MKILYVLCLISLVVKPAIAMDENFMEFGSKDFKNNEYKTSNWVFEFGYSHLPYELVLPEFDSKYDKVDEKENIQLSGASMAFGGQLYFGAGFSSSLKLGVSHFQSLETVTGKATEELDDEDLATYDLTQQVQTAEVTLGLEYLIDTKYLGVQPFVAFSLGKGRSSAKRDFEYDEDDTISADNPENYKVQAIEDFDYNKISLGVNFISNKGLTSYIVVSQMNINKTDREFTGRAQNQSGAVTVESTGDTAIDETSSVIVGSVGLGYMF